MRYLKFNNCAENNATITIEGIRKSPSHADENKILRKNFINPFGESSGKSLRENEVTVIENISPNKEKSFGNFFPITEKNLDRNTISSKENILPITKKKEVVPVTQKEEEEDISSSEEDMDSQDDSLETDLLFRSKPTQHGM